MTENEAKQKLENLHYKIIHTSFCNKVYEIEIVALCMAKDALEKIQQYRAIGTIEEFKALKEKNEPKKPILNNPKINEFYIKEAKLCPACHSYINNCSGDYCRDCGQKLDWSE